MVKKRNIIWTYLAEQQLIEIYQFIKEDSIQNAERIKQTIFQSTECLIDYPEKNPSDKYKKNNNGAFRAYEIYNYRVSYYFSEKEIIILRVRSTKMKPKKY